MRKGKCTIGLLQPNIDLVVCLPGGQRLSGTHIQHKYSMLRQQVYSKVERINRVEIYLSERDGEGDECSKADSTED